MTQNVNSRKIQLWFKPVVALFAAATLIASCSDKDDNDSTMTIDPAQPNENVETDAPKTFTLSIPATFDGSLSKAVTFGGTDDAPKAFGRFKEGEKIHVYNESTYEMCSDEDHYLTPTSISPDGKSCTLTGTLPGTIEADDEITLLYNLSNFSTDPQECEFIYDGSSDILDGGIAEGLKVTSTDDGNFTTESPAVFELCQSIFRFKFVDGDGKAIKVKSLQINTFATENSYRPLFISPFGGSVEITETLITPATPTDDYINVALRISDFANKEISFTVTDDKGNIYKGTKDAPDGGFKNGKYYFSKAAIKLEKPLIEPTITWGEGTPPVTPNEDRQYYVCGPYSDAKFQPSTLTISGTSQGYKFFLTWGSTTTLYNLTAIFRDGNFIYSEDDLNLTISGENTITCNDYSAIFVDGTLKISGDGILTVITEGAYCEGLYATSNYNDDNNSDPSVLAADGYTVTCTGGDSANPDGTYTWTYTVRKSD